MVIFVLLGHMSRMAFSKELELGLSEVVEGGERYKQTPLSPVLGLWCGWWDSQGMSVWGEKGSGEDKN